MTEQELISTQISVDKSHIDIKVGAVTHTLSAEELRNLIVNLAMASNSMLPPIDREPIQGRVATATGWFVRPLAGELNNPPAETGFHLLMCFPGIGWAGHTFDPDSSTMLLQWLQTAPLSQPPAPHNLN